VALVSFPPQNFAPLPHVPACNKNLKLTGIGVLQNQNTLKLTGVGVLQNQNTKCKLRDVSRQLLILKHSRQLSFSGKVISQDFSIYPTHKSLRTSLQDCLFKIVERKRSYSY
jgi:hypothetical protein